MEDILNWSADINNLYFGSLSIFGAHCFYKSSRKKWQTMLTLALLVLFWSLTGKLSTILLTNEIQERAQMFIGYSGILAYTYLFKQIPISQSIFTYFFVVCVNYLSMLLARILAVFASSYLSVNSDIAFFITGTSVSLLLFFGYKKFAPKIREKALPVFSRSFGGLTLFSFTIYTTLLLFVDIWGVWPLREPLIYFKYFMLFISVSAGYYMAFYTLQIASQHKEEEDRGRLLNQQLDMNEKYYDTLLDSISQTRMHNHDLKHHVNTLAGLCKAGKYEILSKYIASMAETLPRSLPIIYCEDLPLNALLNHMDEIFQKKGLPFECMIRLPKNSCLNSMHLCVVFGNALQNAMEASEKLDNENKPFVECTALYEDKTIVVSISNRFDGKTLVKKERGYASSKMEEGHGLGLGSIRTIIEKYSGWMGIEMKDDIFTLKFVLRLKEVAH